MKRHSRDEKGRVESTEPFVIQQHRSSGSGHQLSAYRPKNDTVKQKCVQWMCTQIPWNDETRVDDEATRAKHRSWLGQTLPAPVVAGYGELQHGQGISTWEWPIFPASKCEPQNINTVMKIFHDTEILAKGSHISNITWFGDAKDAARGQQARIERNA